MIKLSASSFSVALLLGVVPVVPSTANAQSCPCLDSVRARAADCLRGSNATLFTDPTNAEAVARAREQEQRMRSQCSGNYGDESVCRGQPGCPAR